MEIKKLILSIFYFLLQFIHQHEHERKSYAFLGMILLFRTIPVNKLFKSYINHIDIIDIKRLATLSSIIVPCIYTFTLYKNR